MNKSKLLATLLTVVLYTTLLTSCGRGSEFTATLTGVDVIQIGLPVEDIPASVRGLYDAFTVEQVFDEHDGDFRLVRFLRSGETVMTANAGNAIWSITVLGANIASADGITPGTPVQTLFERGGRGALVGDDWRFAVVIDRVEYNVQMNSRGMAKREQAWLTGTLPEITLDDFDAGATVISFAIMPQERHYAVGGRAARGNTWQDILIKIAVAIVFLLALLHMFSEYSNDNRVFVGSYFRIFLFAALMCSGLFFVNGIWNTIWLIAVTIVIVVFSYLAYLKPADKILRDGPPIPTWFQILGGAWATLERKQINKHYIELREKRIQELNNNMGNYSEADKDRARAEISSLNIDINNEKYQTDQTIGLLILSIIIGFIVVYFTPLAAFFNYIRNYPLYLRRKKKEMQALMNRADNQ